MSNHSFEFPCYPTILRYINRDGKNKVYHFKKSARIICHRTRPKSISIVQYKIGYDLFDIDKIKDIEYIRNEKRWIKYHGRVFLHKFDGTEDIAGTEQQPNIIRIKGNYDLWGYQKIQDKEVK